MLQIVLKGDEMTKQSRKFQTMVRGVIETMVSKDWVADCVDSDWLASISGVSGAKGAYKRTSSSSPMLLNLR